VHDARSWAYRLPEPSTATLPLPKVVQHAREIPVLDQGAVGSCTANALLGVLGTAPYADKLAVRGVAVAGWDEQLALSVYHDETVLDDREIPGVYPPDDTGSAGLYSMQVAKRRRWITSYHHAFTLGAMLAALAHGPVSIGIPWLNSMFEPDSDGLLRVDFSSGIAGGHQVAVDGYDLHEGIAWLTNSWGTGWGLDGRAALPINGLSGLLRTGGDVVQPVIA
jgi:hypothetical protein